MAVYRTGAAPVYNQPPVQPRRDVNPLQTTDIAPELQLSATQWRQRSTPYLIRTSYAAYYQLRPKIDVSVPVDTTPLDVAGAPGGTLWRQENARLNYRPPPPPRQQPRVSDPNLLNPPATSSSVDQVRPNRGVHEGVVQVA